MAWKGNAEAWGNTDFRKKKLKLKISSQTSFNSHLVPLDRTESQFYENVGTHLSGHHVSHDLSKKLNYF